MNVNFEYYKVFYFVGKLKSITKAAKALSISQPAVSQAIKTLEGQMGVTLFVRSKQGVAFTPEGEMLYQYVEAGYEQFKMGEQKIKEMIDVEIGEIRIGASDMTLQYFLLPFLETFQEKYPNIKVSVTNAPTPETLHLLQQGEIDFGIVSSPVFNFGNYDIIEVRDIQDIFIVGKKYERLASKPIKYTELNKYPMICLEENSSTRTYVDSFLKSKGVEIDPEFQLNSSPVIVQFASRNFGVACVVEDFAEHEIKVGRAFKLKFEEPIPARKMCVVTMKNCKMSTAAEALYKEILCKV